MSATEQEQAILSLTVGEDGRVTIPAEVLAGRGIEPGDTIEVEVVPEGVLLVPVATEAEIAAFWGPNWREMLDEAHQEVVAGQTTSYDSDEEFLADLEALHHANLRAE